MSRSAEGAKKKRRLAFHPSLTAVDSELSSQAINMIVLEPWDLLRGKDVFENSKELDRDCRACSASHKAPNCGTFSRARERPIKGVANPPKPLRSLSCPRGLPGLKPKQLVRVDLDTRMADLSAIDCARLDSEGKAFSLEHPGNCLAKELDSWKALLSRPTTITSFYHACMFPPCERRKYQMLAHNMPLMHDHVSLLCDSWDICSRTGLPHETLAPTVSQGRVVSYATGDEREYPQGFCEAYAEGLHAHFSSLNLKQAKFVEVFSGPNAPLSVAVARRFGSSLPAPFVPLSSKGVKKRAD